MPIQIRLTSEMSGMQGLNIMSASSTHSKNPSEVDQRTYWESDKPGVLLEALAVLVKNSINMTRI
jgi:prephenate dehydratase